MARLITRCISKKPVHCEQSMPLESVVVVVGWGDNHQQLSPESRKASTRMKTPASNVTTHTLQGGGGGRGVRVRTGGVGFGA